MTLDAVRHGGQLVSIRTGEWLSARQIRKPLVVLIHGFASNGDHLLELGKFFESYGYTAARYEYDPYRGFDVAAKALLSRLALLNEPISDSGGYSLIGHSMGGLVARWASLSDPVNLRSIVLLGTPNAGTLSHPWLISAAIRIGERFSRLDPYSHSLACQAALQLTRHDSNALVEALNGAVAGAIPMLSISGGLSYLEIGQSRKANILASLIVQSLLGEKPNDGLVPESSADVTRYIATFAEHCADYADFPNTNHTSLPRNNEVALVIARWLQKQYDQS